jgi:hypothetical protein
LHGTSPRIADSTWPVDFCAKHFLHGVSPVELFYGHFYGITEAPFALAVATRHYRCVQNSGNNKLLGENLREFSVELPGGTTAIFALDPPAV